MSGPKTSEYQVVAAMELQRREDERRKRNCQNLISQIDQLNKELLDDCRIAVSTPASESHEDLIRWEDALKNSLTKAKSTLREQRQSEQRCRLLVEQINRIRVDLTNPDEHKIANPEISSFEELKAWENNLVTALKDIEYKSARDAMYLKKQANKKLDLSKVDLTKKEHFRIDEIRTARRMEKLQTLAESIGEIDDPNTRESFVLEAAPLLDQENDNEFDEAVIKLNTRVRAIRKAQQNKSEALEEAAKVRHLNSPEAQTIQSAAERASTADDVANIRSQVAVLLEAENRELDERYVRQAIRETLVELGYDCGEGFIQTQYGPVAYADKDPDSAYALRIQMGADGSKLFTRVVSRGDTTEEQDKAAEETLCVDYHNMMKGLRDKGIETVLTREAKPGEHPLDKIGQTHGQHEARARRRRRTQAATQRRNA